jgi:hypothetical protein
MMQVAYRDESCGVTGHEHAFNCIAASFHDHRDVKIFAQQMTAAI